MASGEKRDEERNAKSSGSSLIGDILKVVAVAGGSLAVGYAVSKGLDALEEKFTGEESESCSKQSSSARRTHLPPQPGVNCPICWDEYSPPIEILPCQHLFHAQCISRWIVDHSTCPTCKQEISSRFKREYLERMKQPM